MVGKANDPQSILQDQLLSTLPASDLQVLARDFEWTDLRQGDVLNRSNVADEHAYFPVSWICSYIAVTDDGVRVETGLVGREGFVGASIVLQAGFDPNEVIVQAEGRAVRLSRSKLVNTCEALPAVRSVLLRFVHIMMIQSTQTAMPMRAAPSKSVWRGGY
jgi:hypothetical protein